MSIRFKKAFQGLKSSRPTGILREPLGLTEFTEKLDELGFGFFPQNTAGDAGLGM